MPIELLANHPKALAMNGAAFGHLVRLAFHFWLTDCSPLPAVDNQLFVLARAYSATWKANRDDIKAVLQDVIPELIESRALYEKRSSILRSLSDRGASARRAGSLKGLQKDMVSMPIGYTSPVVADRNRGPAPPAQIKPAGPGFVEKPR